MVQTVLIVALVAVTAAPLASGHGFGNDPPSRSSMWRYGYDTPVNYEDNQLFCGGYQDQNNIYGGRCGPCGDPYGEPRPRANENTGKYGRGIVTRNYKQGAIIDATFTITANHRGWVQFSLCKLNSTNQLETEECFQPLQLAGTTYTKYTVHENIVGATSLKLQLPPNQVCQRCVMRWHYTTGNSWGVCSDGTGALGCGPQETFRSCSDISIR